MSSQAPASSCSTTTNIDQSQSLSSDLKPAIQDMATLVANPSPALAPSAVNKRYRPTPAKTFQCRGYGECRMVFSRSEHLARHIRKHTGERPFSCHCNKQFSRLDNLRQHAQTVHADKQDQNERMMRDLTSLHATMAAANKTGGHRGKRAQILSAAPALPPDNSVGLKQEDMSQSLMPMHHRPGTTTGYEGEHSNILYQGNSWHVQHSGVDRDNSRPNEGHSFRDHSQSFLAPLHSNATALGQQQQQQPFLPIPASYNYDTRDGRPGSSTSRPPTAGSADSQTRMLPPLSAVVSATIPAQPPQAFPLPPQSTQHVLPLPTGSVPLNFRRPSTASRPGTAPSSYYPAHLSYVGGPGVAPRSELSFHGYGRGGELGQYDVDGPTSPGEPSPFSWNAPAIPDGNSAVTPPSRKRSYTGTDGPGDECTAAQDYDYGSDSRPQSRRLSVMELCNDTSADGQFLPLPGSASRPTTSTGLSSSTSALALVDHIALASPNILPRALSPAAAAAEAAARGSAQEFGAGRVLADPRRDIAPSSATILQATYRGPPFTSPPLSDDSSESSPRSPLSPSFHGAGEYISGGATSPTAVALAWRGPGAGGDLQHDEIQVTVSPHPSSAVGMSV